MYSPTTTESSLKNSTPQDASDVTNEAFVHDTIHYLSPATTARTLNEGDFDYTQFMPLLDLSLQQPSVKSTISCEEVKLQRTIAIIKPEAIIYKDVVLKTLADNGLNVISERTVHLTPEQVAEIYSKHYGCPYFPNMVVSMSIGPLLVLCIQGFNAIEKWKAMVGPYQAIQAEWFLPLNVRKRFGIHMNVLGALHASDDVKEAKEENKYFFPKNILEPIIDEQLKVEDYCGLYVNPTLTKGLVEVVRKKPVDPIIFLAEWLLLNNPCQPTVPYKYAMSPT